ncbi:MAG TPA: hypothetical protein VI793_08880 [Anaerolineales bacterium]|nr:hypothetical protein [Anaerolineales bacterium]
MHQTVLFDVAGPGLFIVLGIGALIALGFVVLAEAVTLRVMKWGTFLRSLLASFVMNAVSGIAGIFIASLIRSLGVLWWLLAYALSVAVEGGVLMLMNRGQARQNWQAALVANAVSYLPLGLFFILAS